jgi:peptide/nickel transport system substrate-binding protein
MKRKIVQLCLFGLVWLLAACQTAAPAVDEADQEQPGEVQQEVATSEAPAPTEAAPEESADERSGGTLIYALDQEPDLLDPNKSGIRNAQIVFFNIFDALIALDPVTQEFKPWLATSWEISEDGRSYTFHLRDDVTFHDGTPFNAEAVAFNFERHHDPDSPTRGQGAIGYYESSEVLDEFTVRINLNEPLAAFLDYCSFAYRMVSPAGVEQFGDDFSRNPVGTGPFRFVEWVANDHITLERYEDHNWAPETMMHQGPAFLDTVIFRQIPDAGTRAASLENGEVNAAVMLPPVEAERLAADPDFQLLVGVAPGVPFVFALNTTKPPTNELAVRQAMNYGLDREAMVNIVFGPYQQYDANTAAHNILTPNVFGYDASAEIYDYDPERAGQLLTDAGWVDNDGDGIREKDGEPLTIILATWEEQSVADVAQVQLRDIGINVDLRVMPALSVNELQREGESHGSPVPAARSDPDVLTLFMHSRNLGNFNFTFMNDPELDSMLDAASIETDREKRANLYSELSHFVMEQALVMPMYNRDNLVVATTNVRDMIFDRAFFPIMYDTWMEGG